MEIFISFLAKKFIPDVKSRHSHAYVAWVLFNMIASDLKQFAKYNQGII